MEKGSRGYGKGGRGEGGGCVEVVLFSYVLPISHTSLYNSEEESSRAGRAAPDFDWDAAKAGDGNLPGGVVDPEALQKLTSSQEMIEIMSNPRLQVR